MSGRDKAILSTQDAAELYGVHRRTILRWVEAGRIRAHRTSGGWWRIRRADLEAFMHQGSVPGAFQRSSISGGPEADIPRVLVVEDEVSHAAALQRLLNVLLPTALIRIARDGFAAGLLMGTLQPHLMFLDIEIPGLDGVGVARQARAAEALGHMEIAVISGRLTASIRSELEVLGIRHIWEKPLNPLRVVALLEELGWELGIHPTAAVEA